MPFLTSIVKWLNFKRIQQIDLIRNYPVEVQNESLLQLIKYSENTEWGKKFDFKTIASISDFQSRIPIQTYDDIKPYVNRLREGETNLLWPGEIKWFAKSSGTTNDKSKFIPVSKESLDKCHYRGGRDSCIIYANNNPETEIFSGKALTLGGSHKIDNYNNHSYTGDLSAIMIENLPFWIDFIRTPSTEVALLDKWEEKLDRITKESIKENVTYFAGVPSWNLVMMKHILAFTGKSNLLEIWPNLELFIHGGVNFLPYRDQYRKLIPSNKMNYMETYNASEGFFAIQDSPFDSSMLLMLDYGVFFEFIPFEDLDKPNPKVLTIENVEINKNYALLISTNAGLWRYMIGDTISFTSLKPHKIVITGRTKHFINAFGEEVIIDNADKALAKACTETGAIITEYTAAPIFMSDNTKGAHEWLIEFERMPQNKDLFIEILDKTLMNLNSDYEAKRYKDITLISPKLNIAPSGTFFKWMEKQGKLGGQNKVPRLSNNRKYLDELLELCVFV